MRQTLLFLMVAVVISIGSITGFKYLSKPVVKTVYVDRPFIVEKEVVVYKSRELTEADKIRLKKSFREIVELKNDIVFYQKIDGIVRDIEFSLSQKIEPPICENCKTRHW